MKNSAFLIVILTAFVFVSGCERSPKKPGYEFLPDMVHSVPYNAFSPNPITGQTLQPPPEGSIPRGFEPFHYAPTPEDAERAGRELKNPWEKTDKNFARGKFVYETYCLVCHGPQGKGDGPLIPKFPNPPSLTSKAVKEYPEGRLYHIVTLGSGMMPSHAAQISSEDRWKLVMYVQTLQKGDTP